MISSNTRDILLLLQLIHSKGLIDPKSVNRNEKKLANIGKDWLNHKSTQLSIIQGDLHAMKSAPTPDQIVKTYQELLEQNSECRNTTDLANKYYYARIVEVEEKIKENKDEFRKELEVNKVN